MARRKTEEAPISMLQQTGDTLIRSAESLRMAHLWARENDWVPAEPESVLREAARRMERFRVSFEKFAAKQQKVG
jgi:hypothetical protein